MNTEHGTRNTEQRAKRRPNAMTQLEVVTDHLQKLGSITSWDAIVRYRITRLSEYIRQLRSMGYPIISEWERNNDKQFVRYHLERRGK